MHQWKHKSWWERGAINLGAALGIGGLVVVGAGAGMGMQRTVLAADDDPGTGGFVNRRAAVPVFDCPGGAAVDTLHNGDRIFASAVHDELDGWLEIRHPNEPGRGFWIEQRFITPDESVGDLEEAPCVETEVFYGEPPTTTTSSTTTTTTRPGQEPSDEPDDPGDPDEPSQPGQTPTTQPSSGGGGNTATTQPSGGSDGTTTTTEAPDTTPPSLSVSRSQPEIWEQDSPGHGLSCGTNPRSSLITANASDDSGISSLRIRWSVGNSNVNEEMSGSQKQFGPFPYLTIPDNTQQNVTITVTARDGAGNENTKNTTVLLHSTGQCFG